MKNIDDFLERVDQKVERTMMPLWSHLQKYFVVFSGSILTFLLLVFFYRVFQDRSMVLVSTIHDDLVKIEKILGTIDRDCNILSIRSSSALIDFLTVEKFSGSMVGCLNLAHPKKWKGPYLRQNPTIQGHLYEIVHTKEGYFLIPGRGTKLPTGVVLGQDIPLTYKTGLSDMLKPGGIMSYKGQSLGIQLKFKVGDWNLKGSAPQQEQFESVNKTLTRFHEALPFAMRTSSDATSSIAG